MTFRPALRPGAPLLRRDATHLQVGTSPGIVIVDRPGLFALMRMLDGTNDLTKLELLMHSHVPELTVPVSVVITELRALGAVIDPSESRRRRPSHVVAIQHDLASSPLIAATTAILEAAGLTRFDSPDPDLLVIASCGEPSRLLFERSSLLGVDHLPVVIDEDRVRIGPLVRPGRTPCVGCHDLHRTDWDSAWPALLHQLGRRATMIPVSPLDALLTHAAAVELAAELLSVMNDQPARTIGRCLVVGPAHDDRASWPIAFHPGCVCDLLNAA